MKLHLARHGQALSFGKRKMLSTLGRRQARLLAYRVGDEGFDGQVLASPYIHTLESAQEIAAVLHVPIVPCPPLREIVSRPPLKPVHAGLTLQQMNELCPNVCLETDLPYPWWTENVETADDVERRMGRFLDQICPPKNDLLMIGHGASINAGLRHLMRRAGRFEEYGEKPSWNCALSTVDFTDGLHIVRCNATGHLPPGCITSNGMDVDETLAQRSEDYHDPTPFPG